MEIRRIETGSNYVLSVESKTVKECYEKSMELFAKKHKKMQNNTNDDNKIRIKAPSAILIVSQAR